MINNYLAHGGVQSAHLAGVDNAKDQLKVALALPADKPSVTLSFWWRIHTEEESNEFDGLSVVVADAAGNALRSLLTLGSNSAANQWQQQTLDLSEFASQSIQLQFVAQTDSSLVTDFFVDDVAVTACGASQGFQVFLPLTQR
jgi:kumamolisin